MKIKSILLAGLFFSAFQLQAQAPYELTVDNGTYTNLVDGISLNNGNTWDDPQFTIPFGFDFDLLGKTISEIYIDEEGVGAFLSSDTAKTGVFPLLLPYGADIADRAFDPYAGSMPGSESNISYKLEGMPGSRVLKLEWNNAGFYEDISTNGTSTDFVNFQTWFYEGSNTIEIHFGPKMISQPALAFDGEDGALIGFFPRYNIEIDEVKGSVFLMDGNPEKPFLAEVKDLYKIPYLDGIIPNGTIYRFTQVKTSTNELEPNIKQVSISPNPVADAFQLLYDPSVVTLTNARIIGANGQLIRQTSTLDQAINIIDLPAGMYTLQLETKSGQLINKKLIKQ